MTKRASHPHRVEPGPGQESVWDYPRPPALEPAKKPVRIEFGGRVLAASSRALRVLETSHPPTYYIPLEDVDATMLEESARSSVCEWKGRARYFTVRAGGRVARDAAWSYPDPTGRFAQLKDHIAVYPAAMDACYLGDERVRSQEGDFYGGWITDDIVGPFKGGPGTFGW